MGAFPYPTPPTGLFEKLITGAAADKFLYGVDVMKHGYRQNHEERVGFRRTPTEAMYESYPARPGLFYERRMNNDKCRRIGKRLAAGRTERWSLGVGEAVAWPISLASQRCLESSLWQM